MICHQLTKTHHTQIMYALSRHDLNVVTIFTSLQYFDISLLSIMLSNQYFSTCITKLLTAEELGDPYLLNGNQELAPDVNGDFTWECIVKPSDKAEVHPSTFVAIIGHIGSGNVILDRALFYKQPLEKFSVGFWDLHGWRSCMCIIFILIEHLGAK